MKIITKANLGSAFAGESQAHMRYQIYSQEAQKEGFPNVARLFEAIAWAERVHAGNHLHCMRDLREIVTTVAETPFGLGDTTINLQFGIDGETFEITEMYPAYIEVAQSQGENEAIQSFNWAFQAEQIHAKMYQRAKSLVDRGKDIELGKVQICGRCGHTLEGDAPDKCPICGAPKEMYKEFA
ncbi:MAG: rubrerythrin family protein [Candidatus Heimdallarchaeota archaeon]